MSGSGGTKCLRLRSRLSRVVALNTATYFGVSVIYRICRMRRVRLRIVIGGWWLFIRIVSVRVGVGRYNKGWPRPELGDISFFMFSAVYVAFISIASKRAVQIAIIMLDVFSRCVKTQGELIVIIIVNRRPSAISTNSTFVCTKLNTQISAVWGDLEFTNVVDVCVIIP